MISFGVSGHQKRPEVDWTWVRAELGAAFDGCSGGGMLWTSLATGADTIAAQEALARGLQLKAVIPHADYASIFSEGDRQTFFDLLGQCSEVIEIAPTIDNEEAYLAAGLKVADLCEILLVVWDGRPAAGKGGTGDVANYAKQQGSSVIWLDTTEVRVRNFSEANL